MVIMLTGCDWYAEERIIYEDWLCKIDTTGQNFEYLIKYSGYYLLGPNKEKIILFKDNGIAEMNVDGSNYHLRKECSDSLLPGTFSACKPVSAHTPDGFKIIWSNRYSQDIIEYDYEYNKLVKITDTPNTRERNLSYSFDGTKIVYTKQIITDGNYYSSIWIMDYKYENNFSVISEEDISQEDGALFNPTLLLSNTRIVYFYCQSYSDSLLGIYSINIDGTDNELIYDHHIDFTNFIQLVPNRTEIVFCDYQYKIYKFDYNSHDVVELDEGEYPGISSDGSKIAYYDVSFKIVNTNGTNLKVLKENINVARPSQEPLFYDNDEKIIFKVEREFN